MIIGVILINTLNFIGENIYEGIIEFSGNKPSDDKAFQTLTTFKIFWLDILNLSNGIFFLFLFKKMSLKNKNKAVNRGDNVGKADEILETHMSRPNHGTMSVINILGERGDSNQEKDRSGTVLSTLINEDAAEDQEYIHHN